MSATELERAFYDVATAKGLLTAESRAQVEKAVQRARAEGVELTPWRAAFVRGYLNRGEVDALLAQAGKQIAASAIPELEASADEDSDDFRLGALARDSGLVDEDELEKALDVKRNKKGMKIGDALVATGAIRLSQRDALLLLQAKARDRRPASGDAPVGKDLLFGKVALENRLLSAKALDQAIAEQRRAQERGETAALGEVLVASGALTPEARDLVLELQARRAHRPAALGERAVRRQGEDPDALGRVVVENRLVTEAQLEDVLELQRSLQAKGLERPLGELLVLRGLVDRGALDTLLRAQHVRRRQAPAARRKRAGDASQPESPANVYAAIGLAVVLCLFYALSTGGLSAPADGPEREGARPKAIWSPGSVPPPGGEAPK